MQNPQDELVPAVSSKDLDKTTSPPSALLIVHAEANVALTNSVGSNVESVLKNNWGWSEYGHSEKLILFTD